MGLKTFKGGVHPKDGKDLSKSKPIKELLPEGDLVFPLSQHIGAPATPIVAVGDAVLKGQKIAEAGGFVSSPIYSSVSGTVKAIEPRRVTVGDMVNSIIIESDGEFNEVTYEETEDVTKLLMKRSLERSRKPALSVWVVQVSQPMSSCLRRSRTKSSILLQTAQSVNHI